MNRSFTNWRAYGWLLIIACVVYWPLTLGIYSLKNDALIYFLPWRYHISESVQAGYFPFWSPYLYTGLPLHSDMQSGAWNPVVLLTSLFTRYNMQVLQWELLFYLFMAGVGMFKLIRETGHTARTGLVTAVIYMCCGFMTDSGSFIPWITSAAWLPFVLLYFHRLLQRPSLIVSLKLGLFLFLLFTAGYPTFFIYTGYILAAVFIGWMIRAYQHKRSWWPPVKFVLISCMLFGFLALPAIYSYIEFLPYYQRGEGTSLAGALTNPFPPFSSISYLVPGAVVKSHEWIPTDLVMRNAYVGIFSLLFFIIAFTRRLNFFQKMVLGITLFSFLFSLGDATPLRKWCYQLLPLMDRFRHPGIIRLFTTVGILLLAATTLDQFFAGNPDRKKIKAAGIFLAGVISCFVIYYLVKGGLQLPAMHSFKQVLNELSFANLVVLQGVLQLIFLLLFFLLQEKRVWIAWLVKLNVIAFAWMSLPFTFFSQTRTKDVDRFISSFSKGFPAPHEKVLLEQHSKGADSIYGYRMFYTKNISLQEDIISPTVNKDYHTYLKASRIHPPVARPFAWGFPVDSSGVGGPEVSITGFYPNQFNFTVNAVSESYLELFQQYNHHWKAWVNEQPVSIRKMNTAFMEIRVPGGRSAVTFKYQPGRILCISMYISAGLLVITILYLGIGYWRKRS